MQIVSDGQLSFVLHVKFQRAPRIVSFDRMASRCLESQGKRLQPFSTIGARLKASLRMILMPRMTPLRRLEIRRGRLQL